MLDYILSPIQPYIRSIKLIAAILLLTATLVLGYLLKASYEANGELQAHLKSAEEAVATVSEQYTKKQQSCEVTDQLLSESRSARESADRNTNKLIKDIKGAFHENKQGSDAAGNSGIDNTVIRMLDAASCQAKHDGVACSSTGTSAPL